MEQQHCQSTNSLLITCDSQASPHLDPISYTRTHTHNTMITAPITPPYFDMEGEI